METHFEDEVLHLVSARNFLVGVWFNAPVVDHIRQLSERVRVMRVMHPRGHGYANLIVSGIPRFTADVRAAVTDLVKDEELNDLGAAHIILTDGMVGSAVRAFLSTALLLGRPTTPTKVFADLDPAIEWLTPLLRTRAEPAWTEDEVRRVLETARIQRPDLSPRPRP